MKVKIKDLRPNPYRDIKNYPIDRDKVQSLIESIEQTGFWDNILARSVNGHIEIAYGHHRLEALKKVFKPDDEVDIPVKTLDEPTMIRIMANENMQQWGNNIAVIIETVKAIKNYLDAELAKYETWDTSNESIKCLFESQKAFESTRGRGVGQTTILKFLGEPWKQHMIQVALSAINDDNINIEAIKIFGNTHRANGFRIAVNEINKESPGKIPIEDQIGLAERVMERAKMAQENGDLGQGGQQHKSIKTIVRQEVEGIDEFTSVLMELEIGISSITNEVKQLKDKILSFNGKLHEMDIETIKPLSSMFAMQEFTELLHGIKTLSEYFGVQFNNQISQKDD